MRYQIAPGKYRNIPNITIAMGFLLLLGIAYFVLNRMGYLDFSTNNNKTIVGDAGAAKTVDAEALMKTLPKSKVKAPSVTNDDPSVTIGIWTWQTVDGLIDAVGGMGVSGDHPDACLCQAGIKNTKLVVNNDTSEQIKMLAAGQLQFFTTTGDQSAVDIAGANLLLKASKEMSLVKAIMSGGYSWGEDCFMGPESILKDPNNAKGMLVFVASPYCDWNVIIDWAFDNGIPVNFNESLYDPDAINIVNASDHIEAAQKYGAGTKVKLKNKVTGKSEDYEPSGVGTWTPGDVMAIELRPTVRYKGRDEKLVKIVSTRKYSLMMPHILVGKPSFYNQHKEYMTTLLRCWLRSNERIKNDKEYFRVRVAALASIVFSIEGRGPSFWNHYFEPTNVDEKGRDMGTSLGGSRVNALSDVRALFSTDRGLTLADGLELAKTPFGFTYLSHGKQLQKVMSDRLEYFWPIETVVDTTFINAVTDEVSSPTYAPQVDTSIASNSTASEQTFVNKTFQINFATGSATVLETSSLRELLSLLVRAADTKIIVEGYTDNVGGSEQNLVLSRLRAQSVWDWLKINDPSGVVTNDRLVSISGLGQANPIADNSSSDGKARNRRVVITLKAR